VAEWVICLSVCLPICLSVTSYGRPGSSRPRQGHAVHRSSCQGHVLLTLCTITVTVTITVHLPLLLICCCTDFARLQWFVGYIYGPWTVVMPSNKPTMFIVLIKWQTRNPTISSNLHLQRFCFRTPCSVLSEVGGRVLWWAYLYSCLLTYLKSRLYFGCGLVIL